MHAQDDESVEDKEKAAGKTIDDEEVQSGLQQDHHESITQIKVTEALVRIPHDKVQQVDVDSNAEQKDEQKEEESVAPPAHSSAQRIENHEEAFGSDTHEQPSGQRAAQASYKGVDFTRNVIGMDDEIVGVVLKHLVHCLRGHCQQSAGVCDGESDEKRSIAAMHGSRAKHHANQKAVAKDTEEGDQKEKDGGDKKDGAFGCIRTISAKAPWERSVVENLRFVLSHDVECLALLAVLYLKKASRRSHVIGGRK